MSISLSSPEPFDLENITCPLCNSPDMTIIHAFGPFHIVSCGSCTLKYLNPRLRESVIAKIYARHTYFSGETTSGYEDYRNQEKSLRLTFRRFITALEKNGLTSGSLLEVGCGYGYFLDEAKGFFSSITGTELSADAGNNARLISGATVVTGDIRDLPATFPEFDIIVLINVIEHIYHPLDFMKNLVQRLRKGGTIVAATPDIGSFWYKTMKGKWPSFKVPEHVVFYTEKTLSALYSTSGLHAIRRLPFPHAFPLGLILSKFGINFTGAFMDMPVWLPGTMIALSARR